MLPLFRYAHASPGCAVPGRWLHGHPNSVVAHAGDKLNGSVSFIIISFTLSDSYISSVCSVLLNGQWWREEEEGRDGIQGQWRPTGLEC